MLKLPWRTETTPATAPVTAPSPTLDQGNTPAPIETVHTKRARKQAKRPAKKLWPVVDRRGVIVATSTRPVAQQTAETHAAALLEWLQGQDDYAGRAALYAVVGQLYAEACCPALGLRPLPWRLVAQELDELPGVRRYKQHIATDDGRRVKRHVYLLPEAIDVVVELDVTRRCA